MFTADKLVKIPMPPFYAEKLAELQADNLKIGKRELQAVQDPTGRKWMVEAMDLNVDNEDIEFMVFIAELTGQPTVDTAVFALDEDGKPRTVYSEDCDHDHAEQVVTLEGVADIDKGIEALVDYLNSAVL